MTDDGDRARAVRVEIADEAFVRARRSDAHPYLADPAGYGAWWPGARSRPAASGGAVLELAPRLPFAPRQRLRLHVAKDRRDLGVRLSVRGPLAGTAEWYYLDAPDGTVVHYLFHAETGARIPGRVVRAHRASVRAGLHALKDLLESGRIPGDEPHPALLADQAAAADRFRAGVEARRRELEEGRG